MLVMLLGIPNKSIGILLVSKRLLVFEVFFSFETIWNMTVCIAVALLPVDNKTEFVVLLTALFCNVLLWLKFDASLLFIFLTVLGNNGITPSLTILNVVPELLDVFVGLTLLLVLLTDVLIWFVVLSSVAVVNYTTQVSMVSNSVVLPVTLILLILLISIPTI